MVVAIIEHDIEHATLERRIDPPLIPRHQPGGAQERADPPTRRIEPHQRLVRALNFEASIHSAPHRKHTMRALLNADLHPPASARDAGALRRRAVLCLPFLALCLIIATNLKTVSSDSAQAMRRRSRIRKRVMTMPRRARRHRNKPRRHKARFEAEIFRAAPAARFRTRLSAHIANAASQAGRWNRRAYVSWRAFVEKKARDISRAGCAPTRFSCTLRE